MSEIKLKLAGWYGWVKHRPLVIINLFFVFVILGIFVYLMNRPLDVLQNWRVELVDVVNVSESGKAVYNPGDTLVFRSSSTKLSDAEGVTTRMIVCEATGSRGIREIQLDTLPATRPSGVNEPRDNAITIPDVTQFDGLPRDCYLSFDVCYKDVILWRDHCEHAQTPVFTVEEGHLDDKEIRDQIESLRNQIKALEESLATGTPYVAPTASTTTPKTTTNNTTTTNNSTTTNNTTNNAAQPEEDKGLITSVIDFVRGLF